MKETRSLKTALLIAAGAVFTAALVFCSFDSGLLAKFSSSESIGEISVDVDAKYYVNFDGNGGTVDPLQSQRVTEVGSSYGSLPVPTREGYNFDCWATNKNLSDYTPIKYIQGTGTQYIDTGYILQSDKVEIKMAVSDFSRNGSWSVFYGGAASGYLFSLHENSVIYYNSGDAQNKSFSKASSDLANYTVIDDIRDKGKLSVSFNGGTPFTGTYGSSVTNKTRNIFLFAYNESDNKKASWITKFKVYYFQIYDNDVLVRDMIPVIQNSSKNVGMLDLLDGTFYKSMSNTSFVAGPVSDDFSAAEIISSDSIKTSPADTTCYAIWTPKEYKLSLHANDDAGSTSASGIGMASLTVKYDDTYDALPKPSRSGYNFKGWFTDPVGGAEVKQEDTVKLSSDLDLYAHWTAQKYTVNFDPRLDGIAVPESVQLEFNALYGTLPELSCEGKTFLGWSFSELPAGYQPLESIKSSGGAYINTGYNLKTNNVAVYTAVSEWSSKEQWAVLYGATPNDQRFALHGSDPVSGAGQKGKMYYNCGSAVNASFDYQLKNLAEYTVIEDVRNGGEISLSLNDSVFRGNYSGTVASDKNVYLFAYNENGKTSWRTNMRVYYFRLYDGGELKVSLIPAIESGSGKVGMYDVVRKSFYANAGDGSFSAGNYIFGGVIEDDSTVQYAGDHTLYAVWGTE